MITEAALAIVLGGALAAGILLAAQRVPRWSAPSLARRIAPYVRDVADPLGLTPLSAPPAGASWRIHRDRLIAGLGGADALERRLRQAGWTMDAGAFRARQLACAVAGVLIGGALAVIVVLSAGSPVAAALAPPILGCAGAVLCDVHLSTASRRRVARVEEQLPTVLEFLALCLAAGESLLDALRRIGDVGSGDLTAEIRRAVLATGTGSSLTDAVTELSRTLDVPALSRALDQLVAALERGAPLAQVLQAQAADAREDAKRVLIEQAGRKEIAMLVPLVFLILPLSVLFAVFPGVVMLRLGIG